MNIFELLEDRRPTRFVAGRDFDLVPNSEYEGYVLGAENDGDSDARKSTYAVYKHVGQHTFDHFGRKIVQQQYIRIHSVVDPKTGNIHSPYERGMNIVPMFRYTVDQLKAGKLQPETVAVEPATGAEGNDLDPQGLPGQPMAGPNARSHPMMENDPVNSKKSTTDPLAENSNNYQEFEVFLVEIPANVYDGKHYDYRTVPYKVYKGMDGVYNSRDAMDWVNDHHDKVLADIDQMRVKKGSKSVRRVAAPVADNVFFKIFYNVRPGKIMHVVDLPNPKSNYTPPTAQINEAYDDRVQAVADAVIAQSQREPLKKDEISQAIESAAYKINPVELQFKNNPKSNTWKEFVKDVLAKLKGQVVMDRSRGPSASAAAKRESKEQMLIAIANAIQDAAGQAFPDGDPWDILSPKLRRMGIDTYDISKWLAAAAKKHLGVKDFNSYMANMYDDYAADQPEMMLQMGIRSNPYTGKPFAFNLGPALDKNDYNLAFAIIGSMRHDDNVKKTVLTKKHEVVKALLTAYKAGRNTKSILEVIKILKNMGADWPEFDVIVRSIEANKLNEMWPFKKKAPVEQVVKPKRWPSHGDDLEQWMHDTIKYHQSQGWDPAHLFSPAYADYFPLKIHVGHSFNDEAKQAYRNIKKEYLEIVKRARALTTPDALHLNSSIIGDRADWPSDINENVGKQFKVRIVGEDGSKTVQVFYANDEREALSKAIKWAQREWDHIGVECQVLRDHNTNESMQAGDFLMIEGKRSAIAGVIAEIKGDTIVLEGNTYPLEEAEYHGREVKLGKPMRGDVKKFKVFLKDPKTGNIKKVNFGDKNMEIKRDDPARRRSFRARHGCGTSRASDRTKAAYWSCRLWSSKPVSKILKGK